MRRNFIFFLLALTPLLSFASGNKIALSDSIPSDSIVPKFIWDDIDTDTDHPWSKNVSRPYSVKKGLESRHIALWASHGRYYDQEKACWKWQRPALFATTEDLYTQTIVIPYLIPMLEHAGAVVFTPRERDWQTHEVIVDNDCEEDRKSAAYRETTGRGSWESMQIPGFAKVDLIENDSLNPFTLGTVRSIKTTKREEDASITYMPDIPAAGRYAVYVSYQTEENSIPDAEYIVHHKGTETIFHVNQTMGGGTWVYLGTFDFDKGKNSNNCVVLSNHSSHSGVVTADAVRFGGGMGNVVRGGSVSSLPRCLEGARYSVQWSGAPKEVVTPSMGQSDYKDDINSRSMMENWLGGGSPFMPSLEGKKVPIELSIAVHSDAGFEEDGKTLKGSLAVCTTAHNNGLLNSTLSRSVSRDFAARMLQQADSDIRRTIGKWNVRALWDRNYSETRLPEVPSIIFEMLSHQNFPDMRLGEDPNFKFLLARTIYKTILKQVAHLHDEDYVVAPLTPTHFAIEPNGNGKIRLSWQPQKDSLESSAETKSYIIYTAVGNNDFDNGERVKSSHTTVQLEPGVFYQFKVSALNDGGESFPTPTLAAYYSPTATKTVMVVNAFHRLASPDIIDNDSLQGFRLDADMGVTYGPTNGWNGLQQVFTRSTMGVESSDGLGYGGEELVGKTFGGNNFDYTNIHARAIGATGNFNVVSCEREAVEDNRVELKQYDAVDLLFGLEKHQDFTLKPYKTFTPALRRHIEDYCHGGGRLLVSGAYVASDITTEDERLFLEKTLKTIGATPVETLGNNVTGLGMQFSYNTSPRPDMYIVQQPDILQPTSESFCAMIYQNGLSAATAYNGKDWRTFTMGFPLESITDDRQRALIASGIMNFLTQP